MEFAFQALWKSHSLVQTSHCFPSLTPIHCVPTLTLTNTTAPQNYTYKTQKLLDGSLSDFTGGLLLLRS